MCTNPVVLAIHSAAWVLLVLLVLPPACTATRDQSKLCDKAPQRKVHKRPLHEVNRSKAQRSRHGIYSHHTKQSHTGKHGDDWSMPWSPRVPQLLSDGMCGESNGHTKHRWQCAAVTDANRTAACSQTVRCCMPHEQCITTDGQCTCQPVASIGAGMGSV